MPGPATTTRISRWSIVVMASALLVGGAVAALAIASFTSSHERVVSFDVRGSLSGVSLDVDDADVMITGGGQRALLGVQRTDRYAFGHDADVQRTVAGGELRLRSRCPNAVPRACSVSYRVVVPDNVPVTVRTTAGAGDLPRLSRIGARDHAQRRRRRRRLLRLLAARRGRRAATSPPSAACAPQQLAAALERRARCTCRCRPGRYQVEAESASGSETVRGLDAVADAPFAIQALSSSGDVSVEGRP